MHDSKSDKNLAKRAAYALADSTASNIPGLAQAWALSKALYGNALELRQKKALEWVEMVSASPGVFNEQVVSSPEFQDGFVVALEDYIKIRTFLKRRVAQKVFKEFAISEASEDFQLERYNDTLLKISPASIATLSFLREVIIPYRLGYIKEKMKSENLGTEKPYEWWLEQHVQREPLSKALSLWINDEYSPNGARFKDMYGEGQDKVIPEAKLSELFDIERSMREKYNASIGELEYLGLVSTGISSSGGWGTSASMTWSFSDFAYEFIKFIESSPDQLESSSIVN